MNGAQGGMITPDNRDLSQPRDSVRGYWNDYRTWEECIRIGHSVGRRIATHYSRCFRAKDPPSRLPRRGVKFPVEYDTMWSVVTHSPLRYPPNDDRTFTARLNFVSLGNAHILTIPGEACPTFGFYLRSAKCMVNIISYLVYQ